jgi:flagellum-specific ATP synthase
LDGHIVLSREIANAGRYPAVDVLQSVSRLHASIGKPDDLAAARKLLAACALYERNRQLIEIGAYKPGVSNALDRAVQAMPRIQGFFSQPLGNQTPRAESLAQLKKLAASLGTDNDAQ